MSDDPTKWWDTELKKKSSLDALLKNLGDENAPSRVAAHYLAQQIGVKTMLDVGCGPALDRWLNTEIAWHGCDASKLLVEYNAARHVEVDLSGAEQLPYYKETYDLVYSRHLWEHLPHYSGALKEACRVAKQAVMIVFFRVPGLTETIQVKWGAHYNDYSIAAIRAAFEVEWPGCRISSTVVMSPKYEKRGGELILLVQK
ncbi:MAG: methyltransferase domain-containing protein [Minisyncoccia bacterium]